MILLEYESAILRNLLERSLDENEKLSGTYQFCDFDGVEFQIIFDRPKESKESKEAKSKEPTTIIVKIKLPGAKEIMENGGEEYYQRLYGEYIIDPKEGKGSEDKGNDKVYTHAIKFVLQGLEEKKQKELITLAARLRANLMAAPFIYVAEKYSKKESFAPFEIPYRPTTMESIFITPSDNGAIATFAIHFSDPGDRIIGQVFFQELKAARTKIPSAPGINFSFTVPKDLEAFTLPPAYKAGEDGQKEAAYGFVSLVLGQSQLSEPKRVQMAFNVPLFRNYLHYHIKCTKAFLHQRMRARTSLLLRELDNARPAPKKVIKRTAQGKIINH